MSKQRYTSNKNPYVSRKQDQYDLFNQDQSASDAIHQVKNDHDHSTPNHNDGHSNPNCGYTSLSLYDKTSAKKIKKKKKTLWVVLLVLLILCLGGAGFYVWKVMYVETIKPVITNPTKDVGLVTSSDALEDPIYENIWAGMGEAERKHGLTTGYVTATNDTDKDVDAVIDEACKEYSVVICYGQDMVDNLIVKAQTYPHIKFILIEGTLLQEGESTPPPNVFEAGFCIEEASYLAGYLAIKESSRNCLGFIGGKDEATERAYYGFYAGALSVDLNCEILRGVPGAAYDSNRIKSLATDIYQEGAQNIYNAIDPQSGEIIAGAARKENKKMIASHVTSQSSSAEVMATVIKHYDTIVEMLLSAYKQNSLTFGQKMAYGFDVGAIDFPRPLDQTEISDALWEQVEEQKKKILTGTLHVPGTKQEFESKYLG